MRSHFNYRQITLYSTKVRIMLTNKKIRKPQICQVFDPIQNEVHECIVTKCHYYDIILHSLLNKLFGWSESIQRWHLFILRWNFPNRPRPLIWWPCGRIWHSMCCICLRKVMCLICKVLMIIWKIMIWFKLKTCSYGRSTGIDEIESVLTKLKKITNRQKLYQCYCQLEKQVHWMEISRTFNQKGKNDLYNDELDCWNTLEFIQQHSSWIFTRKAWTWTQGQNKTWYNV